METKATVRVLPVIVFGVFCGTSLWFSCNAILPELQIILNLADRAIADLTSAVQLGFIAGTLMFSMLTLADRFPPERVFFMSCVLGGLSNSAILCLDLSLTGLLASRFATGFFLAGVYPVGMKIASLWFKQDLGRAIGHLVGALVLGTAFPHLLRVLEVSWDWQGVVLTASVLSAIGGALVWLCIPDLGQSRRVPHFEGRALWAIFKVRPFRASASGYFGHMWELYTLWAFTPLILSAYSAAQPSFSLNVPLWSFLVIGSGMLGCSIGGMLSLRFGNARIAFIQLAGSCLCCLLFPWLFTAPPVIFLIYMVCWGVMVVGDSPQFSTLNAQTAPPDVVGSALTLVVCMGFGLSIVSLYVINTLLSAWGLQAAMMSLAVGPVLGLLAMRTLITVRTSAS